MFQNCLFFLDVCFGRSHRLTRRWYWNHLQKDHWGKFGHLIGSKNQRFLVFFFYIKSLLLQTYTKPWVSPNKIYQNVEYDMKTHIEIQSIMDLSTTHTWTLFALKQLL